MRNKQEICNSIDYAIHKKVDQADIYINLNYVIEYLNSLRFLGFPVHDLKLKVSAIVMFIRNLSMNDGLCNGTSMKIIELFKFNIKGEIIIGTHAGNYIFISGIILDIGEFSTLPFMLY